MSTETERQVRVLRSQQRFRTEAPGIVTRHCFSFGGHYDPANIGFGDLLAINDEHVDAAAGYDEHHHRDTEIVTWVLEGELAHADSAGNTGTIRPGMIQRMSAGSGVAHSERNASSDRPVHFIQMWLRTDRPGAEPSYEQAAVSAAAGDGFVLVVSSEPAGGAIGIATLGARLWVARTQPGERIALPDAALRHIHVVRGAVWLGDDLALAAGDTVRIHDAGSYAVTAEEPSELLLWGMRQPS